MSFPIDKIKSTEKPMNSVQTKESAKTQRNHNQGERAPPMNSGKSR